MTDTPQRAHEYGEQAAMRGLSLDECPYRLHDLKAHWLRGWHAWNNAQPAREEIGPEGRANLARIKTLLESPTPVAQASSLPRGADRMNEAGKDACAT